MFVRRRSAARLEPLSKRFCARSTRPHDRSARRVPRPATPNLPSRSRRRGRSSPGRVAYVRPCACQIDPRTRAQGDRLRRCRFFLTGPAEKLVWPLDKCYNTGTVGESQCPDLAERKIASMTAMLRTLPSNGTDNSVPSRMLRENRSP